MVWSCDYALGDHTTGPQGYHFTGAARVENTGNVGVMAAVRARWLLLGAADVRQQKTLRLGVGQTRRVQFDAPATRNQIDHHLAINLDRNYCQVRASIVGSFGDPAS